jgi:hypothetical protein
MSKYSRYVELRTPNPLAPGGEEQIYKCRVCNGETFHPKGWDGEPNTHKCGHD